MKHLFILALFLSFLFGCQREGSRTVPLINGVSFSLAGDEVERPKNKEVLQAYLAIAANWNVQPPLFKYIHHPDYDIYITLPSTQDIYNIRTLTPKDLDGEKIISLLPEKNYTSYRRDSSFVAVQLHQERNKNDKFSTFLVAVETTNEALLDSRFQADSLGSRWETH